VSQPLDFVDLLEILSPIWVSFKKINDIRYIEISLKVSGLGRGWDRGFEKRLVYRVCGGVIVSLKGSIVSLDEPTRGARFDYTNISSVLLTSS
jgi:hypothetical protein